MKRKYLLAVLIAAAMPLTSMAQDDDLYFNPKKEAKEKAERRALLQRQYAEQRARRDSVYRLFWSGSDRSVDEYNRGGRIFSHYENVGKDSLGNDIIQFHVGKGVAPDSIYDDAYFAQKYADRDEDFVRTREMSRWDGFYDPWFYDYYGYGPYYWRSRMWAGTIHGATAIMPAGMILGSTLGTILGIMATAAGMVAGTTLGIMAGAATTILGIGEVR